MKKSLLELVGICLMLASRTGCCVSLLFTYPLLFFSCLNLASKYNSEILRTLPALEGAGRTKGLYDSLQLCQ